MQKEQKKEEKKMRGKETEKDMIEAGGEDAEREKQKVRREADRQRKQIGENSEATSFWH